MNGAKLQALYIHIDVLKTPIKRAPTSLVQIIQKHLGEQFGPSNGCSG